MPEVITVTWDGSQYKVSKSGWEGGLVLTLDELEAWLKQCIEKGYVNIWQCVEDMQAWVEARKGK